jgi:hypothetical protein
MQFPKAFSLHSSTVNELKQIVFERWGKGEKMHSKWNDCIIWIMEIRVLKR